MIVTMVPFIPLIVTMVPIQDPFVNRSLLCAQLMLPLVKDMEAPPPKPTPVVDEEDMEENVCVMALMSCDYLYLLIFKFN